MKISGIIANYKNKKMANKVAKEFKKDLNCSNIRVSKNEQTGTRTVLGQNGSNTYFFALKKDGSQQHKSIANTTVLSMIPSKRKIIKTHLVDKMGEAVEKTKSTLFRNNEPVLINKTTKSPSGFTSTTQTSLTEGIKRRQIVSPNGDLLVNETTPIK